MAITLRLIKLGFEDIVMSYVQYNSKTSSDAKCSDNNNNYVHK